MVDAYTRSLEFQNPEKMKKARDKIIKLIESGKPLRGKNVDKYIHLVRDTVVLRMAYYLTFPNPDLGIIKQYAKALNVVSPMTDRYDAEHGIKEDNSRAEVVFEVKAPAGPPSPEPNEPDDTVRA